MTEITLPHAHGTLENRALQALPSIKDCAAVADVFKQLGDGSRLRLFFLLCHSEECVINLASLLNMTSPAISHHLRQLKAAGLIVSRREGKEVYYTAAATEQAHKFHHIIEWLFKLTCPASQGVKHDRDDL